MISETSEAYKDSVDNLVIGIIRLVVLTAILSLNYFLILPTNFLIIVGTLFILSLIVLAWDIYEWRKDMGIEKTTQEWRLHKDEIDK